MNTGLDPDAPLVLKFGGSCFITLADFDVVADFISARLAEASRVIAVVSAMSGTTGTLQEAQRHLSASPPAAMIAQVLTTGDMVSAALLATALCNRDLHAQAVDARDLGWWAAGPAQHAELTRIDPARLWAVLSHNQVAVVPGGQAVGADGHVVMLGRNSSDMSAVAAAVAVGARSCEIFSDVPGVYTADPYLIKDARLISELGYATAKVMGRSGAKVVSPRSVELAERHQVSIICRMRPPDCARGTVISAVGNPVVVIPDPRSVAWAIRDDVSRRLVRQRLADERASSEEFDALEMDHDGMRHVVAPGGDSYGAVGRACATDAALRPSLRLLTTVLSWQELDRVLLQEPDLIEEASRRHLLHYPPPRQQPAGKLRSTLSGLLVPGDAADRRASCG
jgi:aspartate kinase